MKNSKKQYWNGIEQLKNMPEFQERVSREFPEELPNEKELAKSGSSRRDFLKMMGFSVAAASMAACEAPVRKAIPYLNKPVDVDPGIANYYASTYSTGGDYCSIVVKTREGRPIKIEGNTLSPVTRGGTSAQVEASILSLYDKERIQQPLIKGEDVEWIVLDQEVKSKLEAIVSRGGAIRIVSNTVLSPTTRKVIKGFIEKYPTTSHVVYDPLSAAAILEGNKRSFGKRIVPSYHFDKANIIVGFSADFLGAWLNPITQTKQYAQTRKINKNRARMSRHYQYESNLSLTGANADYRIPIKPSREGIIIAQLFNSISGYSGGQKLDVPLLKDVKYLERVADNLWKNRGKSLVVSGSNDPDVQVIVNAINYLLGNYDTTIDLNSPVNYRQGDDVEMNEFIDELSAGKVDAVLFYNANPVYNHPRGAEIEKALGNVELSLSTSDRIDETTSHVAYVAPDQHFLESWNDAEPRKGNLSLAQPAISPIFNSRQAQESFMAWSGITDKTWFEYLQETWKSSFFEAQSEILDFQSFWDRCLHDGIYKVEVPVEEEIQFIGELSKAGEKIRSNYKVTSEDLELVLYTSAAIGDGTQGNNPWLQELPDPVTKACWENYLTVSQAMASEFGIEVNEGNTSLVNLSIGGQNMALPVLVQPGQTKGTVGLALGYGRKKAGIVGNGKGTNAYPMMTSLDGYWQISAIEGISVTHESKPYQVAHTQTHHTYMARESVIQESVLDEYKKDPWAGRDIPHIATSDVLDEKLGDGHVDGKVKPHNLSLWKGHKYPNHHWGMVIDLNSCTGCAACTIACQVENNVPVVGKQEVLNRREMHWIRIDRYFSSDAPAEDLKGLEEASENPEVTFQPIMCQHCNNAPCETVCPVAATTHSTEGLNQMAYNRCIGTRYCANNCPYKVRRFNWFKFHDNNDFDVNLAMSNDLGKMVLNPDVTVRSRGVIEKCSLCIQRIQAGKLEAKKEGRRIKDGEVTTACESSCPADAIVFGDMLDPESRISKLLRIEESGPDKLVGEERAYTVLEAIGVKPNIFYLTKIRNKDKQDSKAQG